MSNQDFTSKVLIGEKKLIVHKNFLKSPDRLRSHSYSLSGQEILMISFVQKFHEQNFTDQIKFHGVHIIISVVFYYSKQVHDQIIPFQ